MIGNKFPEPAVLFAMLAAAIIAVSAIGTAAGWSVQPARLAIVDEPVLAADGSPALKPDGTAQRIPKRDPSGALVTELKPIGEPIKPKSLVTVEGIYWMLSSMIRNFTGLPAVGLVFVSMLGIGLAERFGLFSALMRQIALSTHKAILTPVIVLVGANSSVASDAGYIILPPLAAALYAAIGRHPIAGLAAAFAGVAGGFGGGIFPTAADGFLAGVATTAAHIIDPQYPAVEATHNLYFKSASAVVIMLAGWFVTDRIVEPRLRRQGAALNADTTIATDLALRPIERRGLIIALVAMVAVLSTFAALIMVPGAPLYGTGLPRLADGRVPTMQPVAVKPTTDLTAAEVPTELLRFEHSAQLHAEPNATLSVLPAGKPSLAERPGDRWSQTIVPVILLTFLIPGCAYGIVTGTLRSQKDCVDALCHGIRSIVPVLVIAFFMGQFVNYFQYTGLDRMLAYAGGSLLVQADLPVPFLLVAFVLLVVAGDFAMSGMLSKFGVMAPIFIPMFMMVGINPELTTAAYRIGDSVVNIITPLNSYLLIVLVVLQKYRNNAGLGSLISLMLPYSLVFGTVWTAFLLLWYWSGLPLGTGGVS